MKTPKLNRKTMNQIDHVAEVLARPYRRVLTPDAAGGYTATIHEFPGLVAEGESADEALANLDAAARAWLESAAETGYPVAEPVEFNGCSGKIALRLTRGLHKVVAERAELEGTSVNQLLNVAIATYVGQAQGLQEAYTQLHRLCADAVRLSQWETTPRYYATYPESLTREFVFSLASADAGSLAIPAITQSHTKP